MSSRPRTQSSFQDLDLDPELVVRMRALSTYGSVVNPDKTPIGVAHRHSLSLFRDAEFVQARTKKGKQNARAKRAMEGLVHRRQSSQKEAAAGLLSLKRRDVGNYIAALDAGETHLDLRSNQLTALPCTIVRLTALTSLDLRQNQLTVLPDEIGNLTALETLNLERNKFLVFPDSICTSPVLTALFYLNLGKNQLTVLPDEIGNLTGLRHLNLRGNPLTSLPSSIGNLTALTTLNLRETPLTSLPASIDKLTALTTLIPEIHRSTPMKQPTFVYKTTELKDIQTPNL